MKVVVTGKTGVGKTTLLKNTSFENVLIVDKLIKNTFYKKGHQVFKLLVATYGQVIIQDDKIDTKALGKIVFNEEKGLDKLALLVLPFIAEYIKSLEGHWLIELATYINYEKQFKEMFDKVIIVERDSTLVENKFWNKNGKPIQTIKDIPINADFLLINDGTIDEAKDKLHNFLLSVGFKCI